MAMVYCRKCGNEVHGKFCTSCGTPVAEDTSQPAAGADSGATTVLRAEDLLKMESLDSDSRQTPQDTAPQTPPWGQAGQQASPWPQQPPPNEQQRGQDP